MKKYAFEYEKVILQGGVKFHPPLGDKGLRFGTLRGFTDTLIEHCPTFFGQFRIHTG